MAKKIVFVLLLALVLIGAGVFIYTKQQKKAPGEFFQKPPAYELTKLLEKNGIGISGLPTVINNNLMASVSGILVTFSLDKDLEVQVRALQLVLPRLKMESKPAKEIDLRFNKVIIKY